MKFVDIYKGLLEGKRYKLDYWVTSQYIYFDKDTNSIRSKDNSEYKLNAAQIMVDDTWEEYVELIDYEKCIGCLCEFWNNDITQIRSIGIFLGISKLGGYKYKNQFGDTYKYCKPIKPEEIKFYKEEE